MKTSKGNNQVVVLTTAFPVKDAYWKKYFSSLNEQSFKSFDVLIVDDGFLKFDEVKRLFPKLSLRVVPAADSIPANREKMINIARAEYKYAIFCDFDDYFDENRISVHIKHLEMCDISVCDLYLFSSEGMADEPYFTELYEGDCISLGSVREKNYFGMSNTAVKIGKAPKLEIPESLIAVDWYYFTCLLEAGMNAKFTRETVTYYRQHECSVAHTGEWSYKQLEREIAVKKQHYRELSDKYYEFVRLYEMILEVAGSAKACKENRLSRDKLNNAWWSILELENK